jgi:hypothetical protein
MGTAAAKLKHSKNATAVSRTVGYIRFRSTQP